MLRQNLNGEGFHRLSTFPTLVQMSQTVRLFVNDKRIATAVITKKGKFLQVYPTKKNFVSEDDWRSSWKHETHPQSRVENAESKAPPPKNPSVGTKNWTYKEVYRFTAPPGKYYIGDLCYVLGDDVYDKVFGGQGYEMGLYTQTGTDNFFLVDSTAYGDGLYLGSDRREFAVDAGLIGITPASCMAKNDGGGQIYTFTNPVECRFKNGRFSFTSSNGSFYLMIDTTGDDDNY
jgi:hypothetical protein